MLTNCTTCAWLEDGVCTNEVSPCFNMTMTPPRGCEKWNDPRASHDMDMDEACAELYKKNEAAWNQMTDEWLMETFGHTGLPTDDEIKKWAGEK